MYEVFAVLGSVLIKVEAQPISATPGSLSPLVTSEPLDDGFCPLEYGQVHLNKGYEGNPSLESGKANKWFHTVWMTRQGR